MYDPEEMQCRALLEIQTMLSDITSTKLFTDRDGVFPLLEKQKLVIGAYVGVNRAGNDVYDDIVLTVKGLRAIESCKSAKE